MEGLIVKALSGFYYVKCREGIIQTRGRGSLRKEGITPLVGDRVEIDVFPDGEGVLNSVLPRKNSFNRPPVANVDLMVVVFAPSDPQPNRQVMDRFLITAENKGCESALCMNKNDLEISEEVRDMFEDYSRLYPAFSISCKTGDGIREMEKFFSEKTVALAGPSGVGKSSIINMLIPEAEAETSSTSRKTGRGRHTTRHVELFDLPSGGMLFDTPGFTSLDMEPMDETELMEYYPEMQDHLGNCRFQNCLHQNEPGCAVKDAVARGLIHPKRYETYISNLKELQEVNRS